MGALFEAYNPGLVSLVENFTDLSGASVMP